MQVELTFLTSTDCHCPHPIQQYIFTSNYQSHVFIGISFRELLTQLAVLAICIKIMVLENK